MLYGAQKDKNFLAYSLDSLVPDFSRRWKVSINSQEVLYIRSLAVLLRSGLSVASEAITYMFPLKQGGNGSAVDVTPMDLNLDIPPLRLHDTYQVLHCIAMHYPLYCIAMCCTISHCAVLYCTVLRHTVLCCTALHVLFVALICITLHCYVLPLYPHLC
jgi:hypothetical protein